MSSVGLDAILANQTSSDASAAKTKNSAGSLGIEDFFSLLIKQLEYQDPLNPVENTEFTAQLAQFSSLQALSDMKKSMDNLGSLQTSINNIQTLSFIGKQVNAQGNIVNYSGQDMTLNYMLEDRAQDVTLKIYSDSGKLVRTIEQNDVAAGTANYTWDGKDDSGQTVAQGKYRFYVGAKDYEGNSVSTATYVMGEVTGVRYDDGNTYLAIGDKEVAISDIKEIR